MLPRNFPLLLTPLLLISTSNLPFSSAYRNFNEFLKFSGDAIRFENLRPENNRPTEKEGARSLQLVHVVFRHGDRTPDVSTIYPNDPYAKEDYFPYGKGQLTMQGKVRAYALGELLRDRYDEFLGRIYYPEVLEARSSSYPRTKATLELVLGSLFVPTDNFKIRDNLLWQPIPYDYTDRDSDNVIATFVSCQKLWDSLEDLQRTPRIQRELNKTRNLYDYLSLHSGWTVNSTTLVNFIHNALQTESEWGFELPKWTKKVWPEPLRRGSNDFWKYYALTVPQRRMAVGNLLKKILRDSRDKADERNEKLKERKMFLYAGHDFNIVPMMAALENPVYETPYTAHILFEVHKIKGQYFMKVLYNDYSSPKPKVLKVRDCPELCPLQNFVAMFEDHMPKEDWC